MDHESPKSRELGCWNAPEGLTPVIDGWTSKDPTPDFTPGEDFTNFLLSSGFGASATPETSSFWKAEIAKNYAGDEGRKRARMCTINLRDRDGLYGRLSDVRCPVMWMHGTNDQVYSFANAEREIKMFVGSAAATLTKVEGGEHFLSFSHPEEVDGRVAEFVEKYSRGERANLA
jgi:pimeloyl-ACP methyl ester carboxylesterase